MMGSDRMRMPPWRWGVMLFLAVLSVCGSGGCGCGGCGGDSDPRSLHYKGRWGGMGEEEWLAQHEKRQKEEEEEARRAQEEAKRRQEEERRKQEEAARQEADARRKARTGNGSAPAGNHSGQQTNSAESSDDEASPPPKPKSQLPEAFDQWKSEHFLLARRQFPERFVEAVNHLAQARRGDPELVEMVLDFVWTEKGGAAGASGASSGRSQHTETVLRAAAEALAQQHTPKAAEALRQLLSGQTPTEDHPTAIRCVLAALAAHPTPEHDRLLLQAVLGPENLLVGSALVLAQAIQLEALRVITNQGRPELQEQLARYVNDPALAAPIRQKIEQAFLPNRWEHFRANLLLVQSRRTSSAVRSAIMRQFALWSAQAAQILSLPEGAQRPADQLAQARQAAESLWNPTFAPALHGVLSTGALVGSADLALEQSAAQLAMTIPTPWARKLLADWLVHRWPHRPEHLRNVAEQLAFEPGFLVLLCRLLYEEIEPATSLDPSAKQKPIPGKSPPGRFTPQEKARSQALGPVAKEWLSLWDQASARLTESIFQDLAAAAPMDPPAPSDRQLDDPLAGPFGMTLPLPPQAKRLCQWHADLADQAHKLGWNILQQRTNVYVGRWQVETSPLELAARLERSLPKSRRRQPDSSLLVESLSRPKEPGQRRMVQIRIRPLTPEIPRSFQEEQPLVLEILCVEIAEPTSVSMVPLPVGIPPARDQHPQKRVQKTYQDFTESLLAVNKGWLQ